MHPHLRPAAPTTPHGGGVLANVASPDAYEAALAAHLEDIRQLRTESRDALMLPEGSDFAWAAGQRALLLTGKLEVTCLRDGLDIDRLLELANDRLDAERPALSVREAA